MSILHKSMSIPSLRHVFAALMGRAARRAVAEPGRPESAPTLGAFGLLVFQGEPPRR
jgi:hypothetical protein